MSVRAQRLLDDLRTFTKEMPKMTQRHRFHLNGPATGAATIVRSKAAALFAALLGTLFASLAAASPASALPEWRIDSQTTTTVPEEGVVRYLVTIRNRGDEATYSEGDPEKGAEAPYSLEAVLPPGITAVSALVTGPGFPCTVTPSVVTCTNPGSDPVEARGNKRVAFRAEVDPGATGTLSAAFEVSGGGAPSPASTIEPIRIAAQPPGFGIDAFDVQAVAPGGGHFTGAARHPGSLMTHVEINTSNHPNPLFIGPWPIEPPKDILVDLPPGFVGNPTAVAECGIDDLIGDKTTGLEILSICPPDSQVGTVTLDFGGGLDSEAGTGPLPVFNMPAPAGSPARFGFVALGTVVALDAALRSGSDYGLRIVSRNISEGLPLQAVSVTMWGSPADVSHERERACPGKTPPSQSGAFCASPQARPKAFLRMPTVCSGEPLAWQAFADSYSAQARLLANGEPDGSDPNWHVDSVRSHALPGYPASPEDPSTPWGAEEALEGCEDVPVKGRVTAQSTSINTESASGLRVHLEVPNEGLESPTGIASSDLKRVQVSLPQGMMINPSQAEGLGTCSPSQYESTALSFYEADVSGCPRDAKIGTVEVKTPLLEETLPGEVFVAKPFDNPFGSLLALYIVLEEPQRGILIKMAGEVRTDPATGQITTTFDDLPQQPFTSFDFKFREGARAPLVTPQACGTYTTTAEITGWSDPGNPIVSNSSFDIVRGIGGTACPRGGIPPFKPGLIAGTRNNNAGSYSPFDIRLFRTDAEQQFTNFSIKLPPGITGKLAGIPFCSDAAIAAARHRTGADELVSPSCPAASFVGSTLVGAGVGSVQTYVPGRIYLAGPYNGSALSIAAITAAKVGPFDLGTVVIREALRIDPETAEVFIDPVGSDPLPHIIDGIPTKLRDIRAYVDRPEFVLNPTSCDPTSTASTVLGSGLDFAVPHDDEPVTVSTRFQAADCAALGFKPKLKLVLKGGTKRGGHPALRATYTPRPGDANVARAQVTLPKAAFLDQSHIGTVCTRVQYAKDQCPAKSVYGYAKATTPILDEALQGPVYLRSSEHKLPDLVAGLKSGKIEIDLVGRIDSLDGRIRSTFESTPDAPITKFVLNMQGAKKGLIENSTNLCKGTHRAIVELDAHNGKIKDSNPAVKADCAKKSKKR